MNPKAVKETLVIDLMGCARCGGDGHEGLAFERFTNPVESFTFWAMCPVVNEPILLRIDDRQRLIWGGRG